MATRFEQVLHDSFEADRRGTLAVVCFALGTWVGGMDTAACCRQLAAKGYPIVVITPGNQGRDPLGGQGGGAGVRAGRFSSFGANVDPENLAVALEQPPCVRLGDGHARAPVAGRTNDRNRYLALVVELAPGIPADSENERTIAEAVVAALLRPNSESATTPPNSASPSRVELRPPADPDWFPAGLKHRHTRA